MPGIATLPRRVRFADFELDVSSGQLLKRGVRISLRDQVVEVLTVLLLHRGDLVTREELGGGSGRKTSLSISTIT